MTDYAIIKTGGKQYRVREGDTVQVEKLNGEIGDRVTFDDVLLTALDGSVQVGTPTVDNASVDAEITGQGRGEKLTVFKFKAKTRSRVKKGHRQPFTALLIRDISIKKPRRTRKAAASTAGAESAAPAETPETESAPKPARRSRARKPANATGEAKPARRTTRSPASGKED